MKITLQLLERLNACRRQRELFELYYPEGVEMAPDNLRRAREHGLHVWWLRLRLPTEQEHMFTRLQRKRPAKEPARLQLPGFDADLCAVYNTLREDQLLPGDLE